MKIPVIERRTSQSEAHGHPKYADCRTLPASYMSEYSVLGLVVDKLDQAIQVLSGKGFPVNPEVFGADVEASSPAQFPELVGMLEKAGIYCSMGDVIDSVYQG